MYRWSYALMVWYEWSSHMMYTTFSGFFGSASRWVQERLQTTDVIFISGEESEWHGMDAWRLNLGIAVKSGKNTERKFKTDTVFFFHHGNLTNRDRDIPKIPKENKHSDGEKDKTKS